MNFIWGFIVGSIVMGALMSAACAMRHEKKYKPRVPFPSMQPLPDQETNSCQCKGYQGLG